MPIEEPDGATSPLSRPKFILLGIIILATIGMQSACSVSMKAGYKEDDKRTVERAIDRFHEMYNAGRGHEIYQEAHEIFRRSISEEALGAAINRTQDKYGKIDHVSHRWLNVLIGNPIEVKAVYNTQFQKGEATEEFSWVVDGDKAGLVVYQIFPGTTGIKDLKEEPVR